MPSLRAAGRISLLALIALAVSAPTSTQAAPSDDFNAVFRDWVSDEDITACRFTRQQLINAAAVGASSQQVSTYSPGFGIEVRREIARHDFGGCPRPAAVNGPPAGPRSHLRAVRITRIRPGGGPAESVTIRNTGSRSVNLGGATLRDRSGNRVRIPRGTRLGARRSLRIITGCERGRRKAVRRGSRLFACRRTRVWNDRGDVVRVVDSRGIVVTQHGYGSFRRVARF